MPSRTYSTPVEIMEAILRRLRYKIAAYNDQNCFLSDQPIPLFFPGGKEACTVSPGGGQFVSAMFGGAGIATATEDFQVTVTTLIRHVRDRPTSRDQRLVGPLDGLMTRRGQILGALLAADHDLLSADGTRYLLRDQLSPSSSTAPGGATVGSVELIAASVSFHCPFDWKICDPGGEACAYLDSDCADDGGGCS